MSTVCYNCFHENDSQGPCPFCGYDPSEAEGKYPGALKPGSILNGRYIVGRVLGRSSPGITYVAQDYQTGERVAIKEYFPSAFAERSSSAPTIQILSEDQKESFENGKTQLLEEANALASFIGDECLIQIHSFFKENNTAYYVTEYADGVSLKEYLKQKGGRLNPDEAYRLLLPLAQSLDKIHKKGIILCDIAPDTVVVTKEETAKLVDFGASRSVSDEKSKGPDIILKKGFAPKELYTSSDRPGPHTDVYALGATWYYAVTGKVPPESTDRLAEDQMIPPNALGIRLSAKAEDAILKAMEVNEADRFQSMEEFCAAMAEADPEEKNYQNLIIFYEPGSSIVQKEQETEEQRKTVITEFKMQEESQERRRFENAFQEETPQSQTELLEFDAVPPERTPEAYSTNYSVEKPTQRRKKPLMIVIPILIACAALIVLLITVILPRSRAAESGSEEKTSQMADQADSEKSEENEQEETPTPAPTPTATPEPVSEPEQSAESQETTEEKGEDNHSITEPDSEEETDQETHDTVQDSAKTDDSVVEKYDDNGKLIHKEEPYYVDGVLVGTLCYDAEIPCYFLGESYHTITSWILPVISPIDPVERCLSFTLNMEYFSMEDPKGLGLQVIYVRENDTFQKVGYLDMPNLFENYTMDFEFENPTKIDGFALMAYTPSQSGSFSLDCKLTDVYYLK